jgi:hypothetical protein
MSGTSQAPQQDGSTPVMLSEGGKPGGFSVDTQCRASDVRRSLFLVVAADKGARQPALPLLDVEVGWIKYGKKGKKREQDLYAAIEPHPNVHSHYFLSLSLSLSPSFSVLTSFFVPYLSPFRMHPPSILNSHFLSSHPLFPKPRNKIRDASKI